MSDLRFTIHSRITSLLLVGFCLAAVSRPSCAADWPRWRGPDGTAVSSESDIATVWPEGGPPQLWQTTGMGDGYSSIVTASGTLFTTGRDKSDVICTALDVASGKLRWRTTVGTTSRNVMSTPTVHDGLVYVLDPDGELVCLAASDGTKQWQRSFVDGFGGRLMSGRGYGESPLIDGDRLLCTPGGADAMIVALDRNTGETIWKSPFPEMGGKGRDGAAFSSLNITEAGGVRQIVQLTGRGLVGVDAADGRFLWSYDDISNQTANIPTPVVHGDLVFAANGYHAGSVLLKIQPDSGPTGVTATEVFRLRGNRFQNHHGGFVLIDGHVFGGHGSNNGLPTCLDLATGKIQWKRRGPGTGSASVVAANGHLVFRYQDGVVCLIEATPEEFRLRGTFQTPSSGGDSWSHPVISDGRMFLREKDHLWAYDIRRSAKPASPSASDGLPVVALSLKDASVRMLSADRDSEWPGPLYQFAFEAAKDDALPLISLHASHVAKDGALKPTVVNELQKLDRSFALSVAGTSVSTPAARQLARLKKLVGLDVSVCSRMTDESFGALAGAPGLVLLVAAGTDISNGGLSELAEMPKLVALDLETCDDVTDSSCRVLANMSGLRGLSLRKTGFEKQRVGDVGLEKLTSLQRLELLDLEGNAVSNDGLKPLARLQELRELNLSILPLTDAGLAHLPDVPKLQSLSVRYSEGFAGVIVTDAGVRSLARLSQLTSLNLTGARRITDACAADIAQLKQLQTLNLSAAGLTKDGIHQIQKSIPDCRILSSIEASD